MIKYTSDITHSQGYPPRCTPAQAGVPPTSLVDKIRSHLLKHHPKGLQSLYLSFRHVREPRAISCPIQWEYCRFLN